MTYYGVIVVSPLTPREEYQKLLDEANQLERRVEDKDRIYWIYFLSNKELAERHHWKIYDYQIIYKVKLEDFPEFIKIREAELILDRKLLPRKIQ